MPSTCMPARYDFGIRHLVASIRSSGPWYFSLAIVALGGFSDIDNHFRQPASVFASEFQSMIGHGFHLVMEHMSVGVDGLAVGAGSQAALAHAHVKAA